MKLLKWRDIFILDKDTYFEKDRMSGENLTIKNHVILTINPSLPWKSCNQTKSSHYYLIDVNFI